VNSDVAAAATLTISNSTDYTLTGKNSYTGNTTVNQGTLVISVASIATNSTLSVTNGEVLQFNFTTTNTIGTLVLNGIAQPNGVYNSNNVPTYIADTGSLQVGVSGPGPATLTNSMRAGSALAAADQCLDGRHFHELDGSDGRFCQQH
jgi:autotransporter-associated beta strand protein